MKILELLNNVQIPITNEESDVLGKFEETERVNKKDLNLREQTVANHLVNKDLLTRRNEKGNVYYKKKK